FNSLKGLFRRLPFALFHTRPEMFNISLLFKVSFADTTMVKVGNNYPISKIPSTFRVKPIFDVYTLH
ncbi:MAG TPA: hypothetical protein VHH88_03660, partial [Verrucomicrobiae bacterium]|nr:hypothetical protein [Verrucomicrobiae bacterium]